MPVVTYNVNFDAYMVLKAGFLKKNKCQRFDIIVWTLKFLLLTLRNHKTATLLENMLR